MNPSITGAIIIAIIAAVFLIASIVLYIKELIKKPRIVENYEPEVLSARLISKTSGIVNYGNIKNPSHSICFQLEFLLDDGRRKVFCVDKEIYEAVTENQIGILSFYEDCFRGFEYFEGNMKQE